MKVAIAIIKAAGSSCSEMIDFLNGTREFYVGAVYCSISQAAVGLVEHAAELSIVDMDVMEPDRFEWRTQMACIGLRSKWVTYADRDDEDLVFEALRAGASGYLLKDHQLERMKYGLQYVLSGGIPLPTRVTHKLLGQSCYHPKRMGRDWQLSLREKEILQFTSRGLLYKEIATQLGIRRDTVKKHLSKIYGKLNVQNKIEALNKFYGV
jgi:DNA-binding NarL/FixJ family response regulator